MDDWKVKLLLVFVVVLWLWCSFTSLAYWFLNPDLSQMEVFLHIPKSFVLNMR